MVVFSVLLVGCGRLHELSAETDSVPRSPKSREKQASSQAIRSTGTVQALKSVSIRTPQISGQNSRVTLTGVIPNGSKVAKGDTLAEFDQTAFMDEEREVKAKLDELVHQLEERKAKAHSDAAKRGALLTEAEADLAKAQIQLRKGPILPEIDRKKNEVLSESATARVASLKKSNTLHDLEDTAAVGVLEKKRERLQVSLERIKTNIEKLIVVAPHEGMVAHENVWRNGSMGPPQEGDQLSPGQPVLRIFDPGEMYIAGTVSEADVSALTKDAKAIVYLDAYPGAVFDATLESASPVATAGLDTPVRSFSARFKVNGRDPRLLPDLSASLEILRPKTP